MNRRELLVGVTTLAARLILAPLTASAQQGRKMWRVGELNTSPPEVAVPENWASFAQALRDAGYVEGVTILFEHRSANGVPSRLPQLASELLRRNVDVIFARGPWAARAAKNATTTIPIVVVDLESDPIAEGLVKTLGRPGGNVTGLFLDLADLSGKQLEFLKEMLPHLRRIGVLGDPAVNAAQWKAVDRVAHALAIEIERLAIGNGKNLERVFKAAGSAHAEALMVLTSPITIGRRTEIADLAARYRLPAMYGYRAHVEVGGLMSYGPNLPSMFGRCGEYVARILSGAKPDELPIERPAKFELMINGRAAKALGLAVPHALLLRADELLE